MRYEKIKQLGFWELNPRGKSRRLSKKNCLSLCFFFCFIPKGNGPNMGSGPWIDVPLNFFCGKKKNPHGGNVMFLIFINLLNKKRVFHRNNKFS